MSETLSVNFSRNLELVVFNLVDPVPLLQQILCPTSLTIYPKVKFKDNTHLFLITFRRKIHIETAALVSDMSNIQETNKKSHPWWTSLNISTLDALTLLQDRRAEMATCRHICPRTLQAEWHRHGPGVPLPSVLSFSKLLTSSFQVSKPNKVQSSPQLT